VKHPTEARKYAFGLALVIARKADAARVHMRVNKNDRETSRVGASQQISIEVGRPFEDRPASDVPPRNRVRGDRQPLSREKDVSITAGAEPAQQETGLLATALILHVASDSREERRAHSQLYGPLPQTHGHRRWLKGHCPHVGSRNLFNHA
jgi:hypothetical protein